MKNELIRAMQEAVEVVLENPSKEIRLFHHNDTDGLSSGTILLNAFEEVDYEVSRIALEKPYPQVLEKILAASGEIIVFADFAGKIAPLIAGINCGRNLVLIIDHHPAEESGDDCVINLDGDLFGLKGDRDISASATCFLFAGVLLEAYGKSGDPLASLGALGAIGDGFLVNGRLSGVNRDVLKIADRMNLIRIEETDTGEKYYIILKDKEYSAAEICTALDTLGGVGYYEGGTDLGIHLCQNGITPALKKLLKDLNRKREQIFSTEIELLKKEIYTTENLQWFNVKERFRPMGVKMIGVFCSTIKNMDFLDETKYLAGFQSIPDEVPGFGIINFNSTKISMRVSDYLTNKIREGTLPGLSSFLPSATLNIGGFADACHGLSAATTVKIGQEDLLIEEIEKELVRLEKN